MNTCKSSS